MGNYRLTLSYDGTRYRGWQRLPTGMTVQGRVEAALSELFGSNSQKISLHDYILVTRCANARELMREGASLEEASEASGFGCLRSFYRAFTDFAGQTPGEFARSVRGKGE